jgi:hypothetical protein
LEKIGIAHVTVTRIACRIHPSDAIASPTSIDVVVPVGTGCQVPLTSSRVNVCVPPGPVVMIVWLGVVVGGGVVEETEGLAGPGVVVVAAAVVGCCLGVVVVVVVVV